MLQLMSRFTLLAAVTLAACAFPVQAAETVTITSSLASKGPFTAQLLRPSGAGPFPAVVAMHGCGGLLNDKRPAQEPGDRLGGTVPRRAATRCCFPTASRRAACARSAPRRAARSFPRTAPTISRQPPSGWQASPSSTRRRLALMGWSHGAMAVLWALRPGFLDTPPLFKTAIAFYPGCRQIARLEDWRPSIPLTLLIGGGRRLDPAGALPRARATHRLPLRRVRRRLSRLRRAQLARARAPRARRRGGRASAHVGTDPAARAAAIKEVMDILRDGAAWALMPRGSRALLPHGLLLGSAHAGRRQTSGSRVSTRSRGEFNDLRTSHLHDQAGHRAGDGQGGEHGRRARSAATTTASSRATG